MALDSIEIPAVHEVSGRISPPGSKSIANRALLLAALAKGKTLLSHVPSGVDVHQMLDALALLGVDIQCELTQCLVRGQGRAFATKEPVTLFLGNAGTAMRPLCAALCLGSGEYTLLCDPRMEERPIHPLVDALRQAGADIYYFKQDGYPPLLIRARGLWGGHLKCDGSLSSQFISSLLIAAPMASGDTCIERVGQLVSRPYIDLTLSMMRDFGLVIEHDHYRTFYIKGNQLYQAPKHYAIEPDASSASYFMAAAAIKGCVQIDGVYFKSCQGELAFAQVLKEMGAHVVENDKGIQVSQGELRGIDIDANSFTDTAMTLAIVALFARGTTTIRNIYNWRVKETDRLTAMATELKKVGASVEIGEDFIKIDPKKSRLKTAEINTYNDHRMAMCFTLISLAGIPITLENPNCVNKTYPNFFEDWKKISHVVV